MRIKKAAMIYMLSQEFFIEMDDYQSDTRDKIKIVKPERYLDFIDHILKIRVKNQIKLIALLQISSGARISEILNLKKKDIDLKKGLAKIKVLKKPRWKKINTKMALVKRIFGIKEEKIPFKIKYRQGAINPKAIPLLSALTESLGPEDKLFTMSRFGVLSAYKRMWGITTHSLRHSMITYMISIMGKNWDWIMNHFYFTELKTAHRYFKQSTAVEASKIFEEMS